MNFRNKSVNAHNFAMTPRADIPRSSFKAQKALKTTFDAGYLVPIYVDEVLPGDTVSLNMTAFARLTTPLFPFMDNMHLDTFFFFVPNRLLWDNWQRFMGERPNPDDSIDFLVPHTQSPAGGYAACSLQDYMGLPTIGQVAAGQSYEHCSFWPRAYNLIYNEWFRDENLQDTVYTDTGDGPDDYDNYVLRRRGKRHDYFTSALPWPQKGESVQLPLGSQAPIRYNSFDSTNIQNDKYVVLTTGASASDVYLGQGSSLGSFTGLLGSTDNNLYADLSDATAATINQLRQSFQIQKLLERDARGGTRYTEIIRSHFGVVSPDARLQRPEYLGGGSTPIMVNPIAQTSATDISGSSSPQGNLAAMGTALANRHGFTYSATEHGVFIGLVNVRADLTYQQGLHRMWSRQTRYDFYFPVFSHLGEQAILSKEIYCDGTPADESVFGYQERWAEYRYKPSQITGMFRSTTLQTLDAWHLAQRFNSRPLLNESFIVDNPPISRVSAIGTAVQNQQFLLDCFFDIRMARPLPMYSVPGLIDHF